MAESLSILGIKRALVVSGFDGYDEISLCAPTHITELKDGNIKSFDFTPLEVGLDYVDSSLLAGGSVEKNTRITMDIFRDLPSPKLDLVALNMGAALYLYGQAQSIAEGFFAAKDIIASQKVLALLESLRGFHALQ